MKKIIALLLALALTLSCAAVLAEAAEEKQEMGTVDFYGSPFMIKGTIPNGYTYHVLDLEPGMFINANVVNENDPDAPYLNIQVYLADNYEPGIRLNDVDDETLREIEDSFALDNEVEIEYTETAYGTKLMKVTEIGGDPDWIAFYSIYEGYEIELTIHSGENGELSEETVQNAIKFLSEMDFIRADNVSAEETAAE